MNMPSKLTAESEQLTEKKIHSFRELIVWQKSLDLAEEVYLLTRALPSHEQFGLTSQVRRSAVSIPSNIAEGRQRGTRKDFVQFLRIADGSAAELETQLLLVNRMYQLDVQEPLRKLTEIQKMLGSMIVKLSAVSRKL